MSQNLRKEGPTPSTNYEEGEGTAMSRDGELEHGAGGRGVREGKMLRGRMN